MILHLPWWFIRDFLWQLEGANSPDELQRIINMSKRKKVPNDEYFYVHFGDFSDAADLEAKR